MKTIPTFQQAKELLPKMTIIEKIGQMNQLMEFKPTLPLSNEFIDKAKAGLIGSVLNVHSVEMLNQMQKLAVEESRLGIPILFARDVIHGYRTIFPINLGLACSFNPDLIQEIAETSAQEAASQGIRWTFAPMMDISRDPRWGRVAEGCGEDPYLAAEITRSWIKGLQGETLQNPNSIAACAKHYVGYGAVIGGRDYNSTLIPTAELHNIYLPPFKAAVEEGCATVMSSFNDVNGIPVSGSKLLLKEILRKQLGFNGVLVSDWNSVGEMVEHGFVSDLKEAAKKALDASLDIDMMSFSYEKHLEEIILENPELESLLDEAVLRILNLKVALGLFENPYGKTNRTLLDDNALQLAKKAAEQSAVLLQNKNEILPLKSDLKKIALIGPMADNKHDQMGTWVFDGKKRKLQNTPRSNKRIIGQR